MVLSVLLGCELYPSTHVQRKCYLEYPLKENTWKKEKNLES